MAPVRSRRIGDQDGGGGGVLLDLLTQPVDMGFERMGGDAGIVAPDFLQQRLARDRPLAGPIEKSQDRGLLLGETDLVSFGVEQELRAWPERVRPDAEHGVLAGLVLAQLGADAREQHREAKRLGHVVVGAGLQAEDRIGVGVAAGEHDDRRLEAVLAQDAHRLAPIDLGQAHVHDHQVDLAGPGGLYALGAAVDRD